MVEKTLPGGYWPHVFDPLRSFGSKVADWLAPPSEACSDDDAYNISVELPGVAERDIDVTVDNGLVTIKGEKKTSHEEKGETWYFSERQYGSFSRSFRLPADADEGAVKADLRDGVLKISVAKIAPAKGAENKKIPINIA